MVLIAFVTIVQAQPPAAPKSQEDRSILSLDYDSFDQTAGMGWRPLSNTGRYLEAANLIEFYLGNRTELDMSQRILLRFHAAQMYAFADKTQVALDSLRQTLYPSKVLDSLSLEDRRHFLAWNAYVHATMAFLRKDRVQLRLFRDQISNGPLINGTPMNLDVVDRMILHFDKPYKVAYFSADPS